MRGTRFCLALLGALAVPPALAQSTAPQIRSPALEAQRPAFEAYQKCVAEHRKEVELHYAAGAVIDVRDRRAMIEGALASDPRVRAQYPGGVDQVARMAFERYKSLDGPAASPADVRPEPTPCPTPGPRLPR